MAKRAAVVAVNPVNGMGLFQYLETFFENGISYKVFGAENGFVYLKKTGELLYAVMRGVPAELLIYPDENHWVLKPQNGILWQRTFFEWLDKWLK